jgi:hypothetical protein
MTQATGQPGETALPHPMGIGEILSTAFQLYRRPWRTLLAIAAVVVVPSPCCNTCSAIWCPPRGETTRNGVVVETATWAVGIAGLLGPWSAS